MLRILRATCAQFSASLLSRVLLTLLLLFIARPSEAPKKSESGGTPAVATPLPCTPGENEYYVEEMLCHLYNGLAKRGLLPGRIDSIQQFWEQDLSRFISAFEAYAPRGGVVYSEQALYDPSQSLRVTAGTQDNLVLSMESPALKRTFERSGLPPSRCSHLEPVTSDTPNTLIVLGANVQKLYACELRNAWLSRDPFLHTWISPEFLSDSGIETFLTSYLHQFESSSGLLESHEVDLDDERFSLTGREGATKGTPVFQAELSPDLISIYETAEAEASALALQLAALQQEGTSLFVKSGRQPLLSIDRDTITKELLRVVRDAGIGASSAEIRAAFIRPLDFDDEQATLRTDRECELAPEPDGSRITPRNRCVMAIKGYDHNGAIGPFNPYLESPFSQFRLIQTFRKRGYRVGTIDFNAAHKRGTTPAQVWRDVVSRLRSINDAQSLILDVHGNRDGEMTLECFDNVEFGTPECCARAKEAADALGINTGAMQCSNYPLLCDPSGTVCMESTSSVGCAHGRSEQNRCMISLTRQLYATPRSFVSSSQCYGGACRTRNWSYLDGRVTDFVSGPHRVMYSSGVWQFDLLSKDLDGQRHVRDERIYGFSSHYSAEGSLRGRGTSYRYMPVNPNNENHVRYGPPCVDEPILNARGFRMYCDLTDKGNQSRSVELNPAVDYLDWSPFSGADNRTRLGSLMLWFTSAIFLPEGTESVNMLENSEFGSIEVEEHQCPRIAANMPMYASGGEPDLARNRIRLQFNPEAYAFLSEDRWTGFGGQDPGWLVRQHGYTAKNWPYYLEITVNGLKAPNKVPFVGNENGNFSGEEPWVWHWAPNGSPLWSFNSGAAESDTIKIRIPCEPVYACIVPTFSQRACGDGSPNWEQDGHAVRHVEASTAEAAACTYEDPRLGIELYGEVLSPWTDVCIEPICQPNYSYNGPQCVPCSQCTPSCDCSARRQVTDQFMFRWPYAGNSERVEGANMPVTCPCSI